MKSFVLLVSVWLAAVLPAVAFGQGVAPAEYAPGVVETGRLDAAGGLSVDQHHVLGQLPVDDSEKWRIELFTTEGCGPCEALKAAFEREPVLRALRDQTHFSVHDLSRESQRRHWRNFQVTQYPTIVLSPPRNSEVLPYMQVFRQAGFDGDGAALGGRMLDAIRRFLDARGRWQPNPQPQPGPRVEPQPTPYPNQNPFDRIRPWVPRVDPNTIPDFPPPVKPDDKPAPPDDQKATYPHEPTITIVLDPQGLGEKLKARAVERIAERIARQYGAAHKIRTLRLAEAQALGLPVRAIDTPALVGSREGRMTAFLAGSVVPLLLDAEARPAVAPDGGSRWGFGLIAALAGGGSLTLLLVVAGVIVAVVLYRRRQAKEPEERYAFGDATRAVMARFQAAAARREAADREAEQAKKDAARAAEDRAAEAQREAAEAEKAAASLKG